MGTHKLGRRLYANKHIEFLSKFIVNPKSGCWEWQKGFNSNGYGRIKFEGKNIGAHRYAYKHYIGEIPDNLMVLHDCDNKKCCNPFHIHKGDGFQNHKEARDRGLRPSGEHPSQKTYKEGCRCPECKALHKQIGAKNYKKWKETATEEEKAEKRAVEAQRMREKRAKIKLLKAS